MPRLLGLVGKSHRKSYSEVVPVRDVEEALVPYFHFRNVSGWRAYQMPPCAKEAEGCLEQDLSLPICPVCRDSWDLFLPLAVTALTHFEASLVCGNNVQEWLKLFLEHKKDCYQCSGYLGLCPQGSIFREGYYDAWNQKNPKDPRPR